MEHGLSNSWVQSILKDSRGFVWFGTQDGLNRYDGSGIKIYRHDPKDANSLPSSVIGCLFEDSKKRLWIGSGWAARGVALYDRAHDRFRTFLPSSEAARNHVRTIIEDRQGQIWLGTSGGVARIDAETGVIQLFPLTPDGSAAATAPVVLSLHEDRRGRLWAGTDAGLFEFDRTSGRYERWPASTGRATGLSRAEVWDLHEDDEGGLWVATLGGGLCRADLATRKRDVLSVRSAGSLQRQQRPSASARPRWRWAALRRDGERRTQYPRPAHAQVHLRGP